MSDPDRSIHSARNTRRRLVAALLCFGLAGLATSIAIAWALVSYPINTDWAESEFRFLENDAWRGVGEFAPGRVHIVTIDRAISDGMQVNTREAQHRRISAILFGLYDPDNDRGIEYESFPSWTHQSRKQPQHLETRFEYFFGWPFLCLRSSRSAPGPGIRVEHFELAGRPDSMLVGTNPFRRELYGFYDLSYWHRRSDDFSSMAGLPIGPIWHGLILNTILFGTFWFPLITFPFVGVRAIRRWLRKRKNRCVYCGYDRRASATTRCPECGIESSWRPTLVPNGAIVAGSVLAGILCVAVAVLAIAFTRVPPVPRIHHAAYHGDIQTVRRELKRGVDVNSRGDGLGTDAFARQQMTPLMLAAAGGSAETVRVLLGQKDVDIDARNYNLTALHYACQEGHLEIVDLLLDGGVDVAVHTVDDGGGILSLIAWAGDTALFNRILESGYEFDPARGGGESALLYSLLNGSTEITRALLSRGVKPPEYVLVDAIVGAKVEALNVLTEYGVQFEALGKDGGYPALHLLAFRRVPGIEEVGKFLLGHGIEIDDRDSDLETPLMTAATQRNAEALRFLLDHGAQIELRDARGLSALDHAIRNKRSECVRILLENGAQAMRYDDHGQTRFPDLSDPEVLALLGWDDDAEPK